MNISYRQIASRCFTGRCPNCGEYGMFKNWFRLRRHCPHCSMPIERDESGFYLGTTSIGYVLAIIFVIVPVCVLVVMEKLEVWTAISIGIIGSVLLCIALYPLLLSWVILCYFLIQPYELPGNNHTDN